MLAESSVGTLRSATAAFCSRLVTPCVTDSPATSSPLMPTSTSPSPTTPKAGDSASTECTMAEYGSLRATLPVPPPFGDGGAESAEADARAETSARGMVAAAKPAGRNS